MPVFLDNTFTYGATDKPTEPSGLELPSRTLFLLLRPAFLGNPARLLASPIPLHGYQEEKLPLHMRRYLSPPLLVAVYGFDRRPEQLGHLGLRLVQFLPEMDKLIVFQECLPEY